MGPVGQRFLDSCTRSVPIFPNCTRSHTITYTYSVLILNLAICDTEEWLRFRNSCYIIVKRQVTCADARKKCENYGVKLAVINDTEEKKVFENKDLVRVNI